MKHSILKSVLFSLVVIVSTGVVASCFAYVYVLLHHTTSESITIPHIYYSVKTITSIDAAGNGLGNEAVYRVDGMNGQPVKIVDLPAGYTGAQWAPSTIQYDIYSTGQASLSTFHVTLNSSGHTVWNTNEEFKTGWGNTKGQVLFRTQWIHPDGTYVAVSEIYCINTTTDGPCSQSFRLIVTDLKTSQQKTYTAKTFGVDDGQLVISIMHQVTSTSAYVQISGLQDPGNAFIGLFDFSTGKVVRTLYHGTFEPYSYKPYQFVRLSDDGTALYLAEWYFTENDERKIEAMDTQTGQVTTIVRGKDLVDYEWPAGSSDVYYKPNDTTLIKHNAVTGQETSIAWTKSVQDYLHPSTLRFTATTVASTSGVYDGKLIVTDTATGKQCLIYDQARNPNAYGGNGNVNGSTDALNAMVGDQVYRFLGIEQ